LEIWVSKMASNAGTVWACGLDFVLREEIELRRLELNVKNPLNATARSRTAERNPNTQVQKTNLGHPLCVLPRLVKYLAGIQKNRTL
jgi:hypothetical protein